jgi:hypothetical protein
LTRRVGYQHVGLFAALRPDWQQHM